MSDSVQIIQTTNIDIQRVSEFLDSAKFVHRHLDWHPLFDWIESEPFLVLTSNNTIHALLALPPDPPHVAWVRCFAADDTLPLASAWHLLYEQARTVLDKDQSVICAVGLEDWFSQLLEQEGFRLMQRIVVLAWNHHLPPAIKLPEAIHIRPMELQDLPQVAQVDSRSFEPVWVNTLEAIRLAYLQSEHTSVAEVDGQIIGFEMSTSGQYSSHLARLAVLPEYRHKMIAKSLVREMLAYYSRHGVLQTTVNTQNDNQASLNLYKSLGFTPTFEEYPVFSDAELFRHRLKTGQT